MSLLIPLAFVNCHLTCTASGTSCLTSLVSGLVGARSEWQLPLKLPSSCLQSCRASHRKSGPTGEMAWEVARKMTLRIDCIGFGIRREASEESLHRFGQVKRPRSLITPASRGGCCILHFYPPRPLSSTLHLPRYIVHLASCMANLEYPMANGKSQMVSGKEKGGRAGGGGGGPSDTIWYSTRQGWKNVQKCPYGFVNTRLLTLGPLVLLCLCLSLVALHLAVLTLSYLARRSRSFILAVTFCMSVKVSSLALQDAPKYTCKA